PMKEHMMKSRSIYRQTKTMFIMAYLGPFNKDSDSHEPNDDQVICKITAINEKTIIFEPDTASDSIRLEGRYGIYSASLSIDGTKFDEISLVEEEDDWIQSREQSFAFDIVEEGAMKLDYFIQIERAMSFPHDGLYVEYKVELPGALVPTGVQTMGGTTQISYSNENDVATFAHLISLSTSTKRCDTETDFFMPRVLFRVCAESAWGRHYVDGYGVASLPVMPGRHEITVNCWRPVNRMNRKAALQERFVSQAVDVKSFEECCFKNPLATMGKRTSWIGLTAETSGALQLKVDCIVQSRLFISQEHLHQMKYGTMMNRFGLHSNVHWRILKALLDFEQAKKQLLQVRSQRVPR
uniref:Meckel syndrome type 1 protein n=1 Tax=Parascaris univalens TaxID=6257 RepID=A0A915BFM3_PARUN